MWWLHPGRQASTADSPPSLVPLHPRWDRKGRVKARKLGCPHSSNQKKNLGKRGICGRQTDSKTKPVMRRQSLSTHPPWVDRCPPRSRAEDGQPPPTAPFPLLSPTGTEELSGHPTRLGPLQPTAHRRLFSSTVRSQIQNAAPRQLL